MEASCADAWLEPGIGMLCRFCPGAGPQGAPQIPQQKVLRFLQGPDSACQSKGGKFEGMNIWRNESGQCQEGKVEVENANGVICKWPGTRSGYLWLYTLPGSTPSSLHTFFILAARAIWQQTVLLPPP
eukprot:1159763-Pelagomonas_calceolata.AAC.1